VSAAGILSKHCTTKEKKEFRVVLVKEEMQRSGAHWKILCCNLCAEKKSLTKITTLKPRLTLQEGLDTLASIMMVP